VAECYDLRTGEIYYDIPTADGGVTPSVIAYSGSSAQLIAFSGNRMYKINPLTGAVTTNVTLPTGLTSAGTYYMNQYTLQVQNLGSTVPEAQRYRLINFTTAGNGAIVGNISWPTSWSPLGAAACLNQRDGVMTVSGRLQDDFSFGGSAHDYMGIGVYAVDLKTGRVLWNKTYTDCYGYDPMQATVSDHGKFAVCMYDGTWWVWNVFTGDLLFKTERMDYPWDANGFGAYQTCSAYGMFFRFAYGGVYAFNWTNGKIVWKYEAPAISPYESPYTGKDGTTIYSFNANGMIADGKLWAYNTEHSATTPRIRGWSLHCINVTTGEGIWRLTGESLPSAIADGYAVWPNSYDGTMYVIGKGKSATTVTAPDTAVPLGTAMVIKGTVLDMSPAQAGTPCVAKESMTLQMEYLHQNGPIADCGATKRYLAFQCN